MLNLWGLLDFKVFDITTYFLSFALVLTILVLLLIVILEGFVNKEK